MKNLSYQSLVPWIGFMLVLALFPNCKKDAISTNPGSMVMAESEGSALSGLTQTRTGNVFNNLIPENQWLQASPQHFSADDNSYAISKKLSPARGSIPIVLQDFRFEIPSNAIIESIIVSARRFKTAKGSLADHMVYLVTHINPNPRAGYGVIYLNSNLIPNTEAEIIYSQNGTGDNGGLPDENGEYQEYQWTPAMINDPAFGVWFAHAKPKGSLVVYYDQVNITVQYSLP